MSQMPPEDPTHVPGDPDPDFQLPEDPAEAEMALTIPQVPAPAL